MYVYCINNPVKFVDLNGENQKDIFYGVISAVDENCLFSINDKISNWFNSDNEYSPESNYDYYLGRVVGDTISALVGAGISEFGISLIVSLITAGGGVTVGSGGTLAVGGMTIAVEGSVVGTATVTYGNTTIVMSSKNFNSDYKELQRLGKSEYKKTKSGSGKEKATDVPSWARNSGERPFKGESGKDFAKRLCDERYGEGNYQTGAGTEFNKIKKMGR